MPSWPLRVDVSRAGTAAVALEPGALAMRQVQGAAGELSPDDALVLFTAGTTDRAKMVPLTHANVAASVRGICATYELGTGDATVAVMPFFHGHGLFAALLASLAAWRVRPAARAGTVLGPHVLGRHARRVRHLVHRGPDHPRDPPGPVGDRVPGSAGATPEVRTQLQRASQHGDAAGT